MPYTRKPEPSTRPISARASECTLKIELQTMYTKPNTKFRTRNPKHLAGLATVSLKRFGLSPRRLAAGTQHETLCRAGEKPGWCLAPSQGRAPSCAKQRGSLLSRRGRALIKELSPGVSKVDWTTTFDFIVNPLQGWRRCGTDKAVSRKPKPSTERCHSTRKTVRARLWPWLPGKRPQNVSKDIAFLARQRTCHTVV